MKDILSTSPFTKKKAVPGTTILTVVVLLSLGLEFTTREFEIGFKENEPVDQEAEAKKVAELARKKYTSIMRMGGEATVFNTKLTHHLNA
jgi:hypothetical protein